MLIDRNNTAYQFQCENHLQTKQWMNTIIANVNCINIPKTIDCKNNFDYCCNFTLPIPYKLEYKYTLQNTIIDIIKYLQRKYTPIQFEPIKISPKNSFINKGIEYKLYDWDKSDINITSFDREIIIAKGIYLLIDIAIYKHIISTNISCPNINSNNSICNTYNKLKNSDSNNNFEYFQHITEYNHYRNEYSAREEYMLGNNCYYYKRLIDYGYDLNDRIHIKLYKHISRKQYYRLRC